MTGQLVTYTTREYSSASSHTTVDGSGYRIGDNYILTAAHVFFDWNRDSSSPTIDDIWAAGSNFWDYRGHRFQYLTEVEAEIVAGSPYPVNRDIEGHGPMATRDTLVVQQSGSLGSNDDGLVVFLDHNDLENVTGVLNASTKVLREGSVTNVINNGTVLSTTSNGRLTFSVTSSDGDSGGAYLLRYDGRDYVIGTHNGNVPAGGASGTYFTYTEWTQINALLENGHSGDVTGNEPTNLVVGSSGSDYIVGSYRPDILIGRAGEDSLSDGDSLFDTVFADDILIGGADNDLFFVGAGDDTIWGGDEDDDSIGGGGTDTVSYVSAAGGIVIRYDGSSDIPGLTVNDGSGGTDILHSIELITATDHSDRFEYAGLIPTGYSLTVDMAGNPDSYLHFGAADDGMVFTNGVITNTNGGGTITLLNVHTQIYGTIYEDEITDEADGEKRINAGGGDDVVVVGGEAGNALIRGGEGADEITGGDGNDRLFGEQGDDIVHGGDGSDFLSTHDHDVEGEGSVSENDELNGGDGHDYLFATATSSNALLIGGAGNDVIDARESNVAVRFGEGDGHDMILSDRELGVAYAPGEEPNDGVGIIDMTSVSKSGVTIIWNPQIILEHNPPSGNPQDIPGSITRQGDLVIRIDATGDTILIANIRGTTTYWDSPPQTMSPPFDHIFDWVDMHELNERVEFSDGFIDNEDYLGSSPVVSLNFGSIAAYATALEDYQGETAGDPEDSEGTSGADDLGGSQGDDAIDGGDGDDNIRSSGGNDNVDGGAGLDTLTLFGARGDFAATRDETSGAVTLRDTSGMEGKLTIVAVETIHFATDNENWTPEELVGFHGTAGVDTLTGTGRDNEMFGLAGNDSLAGAGGDDLIDGGDGDDSLDGGDGDDLLIGGDGDNALAGGDGADSADYAAAAGAVTVDLALGAASANGFGDADTLAGIENVTGSDFADTLTGDAGANRLDGGADADAMEGGDGDDTYLVDDSGDVVTEAADEGSDTIVTTLAAYTLGAHLESLLYAGGDSFAGTGNALANLIAGGSGDDSLVGGDGDDSFTMSWGEDEIDGGDGSDVIHFAGTIYGNSYSRDGAVTTISSWEGTVALTGVEYAWFAEDGQAFLVDDLLTLTVTGTAGDDTMLEGSALNNNIYGLAGNDTLWGKQGSDTLDGGDGTDIAHYAGSSADFTIYRDWQGYVAVADLVGDDSYDLLIDIETVFFDGDDVSVNVIDLPDYGTSGNDSLVGSARRDTLFGEDGDDGMAGLGSADMLYAGAGDDELDGGDGDDKLYGGGGADLYLLGAGDDEVSEDDGDDSYVYDPGDGDDIIWEYGGFDVLAFGAGIDPEDVIVTGDGDSYVLTFDGAAGSITIGDGALEDGAIEEVHFDDLTIWTAEDLHDLAGQSLLMAFAPAGGGGGGGEAFGGGGESFGTGFLYDYGFAAQVV